MARKKNSQPATGGQIQLFRMPEVPEPYKKAVEVLHSRPLTPLTLMHRKLQNAWLKNAQDERPDAEGWWSLSMTALSEDIGFDSNNREHLKQSAREMMSIIFEWDVMADKQRQAYWKASVLFPEVEVHPSGIRYQISKQIQSKVLNPEIYALIDQRVIKEFRRATSVGLYEFCKRYHKLPKTPTVPWELFRDMIMGTSADLKSYRAYKVFKDKVLKPAIAEVRVVASLDTELVETRAGRKVVGISFLLRQRIEPDPLGVESPDELQDMTTLLGFGLPRTEALKLVRTYSHAEIEAAVSYTRKRQTDKRLEKIDNPTAYLRRALTERWAVVDEAVSPNQAPEADKSRMLEEACLAQRDKDASSYFYELDPSEQQRLIDDYNAQQEIPGLRIKTRTGKPSKAATAQFFRWLAKTTWGELTPEQLLRYANQMLFSKTASAS